MTGKQADDNVHVIWHDVPGEKTVTLVVEVAERGRYLVSDGGVIQVTGACAMVQIFFDNRRREALNLPTLVGA
jgi:hypothetical protein